MIKTNTKKAKERINNYIIENSKDYLLEYGLFDKLETKEDIHKAIATIFYNEVFKHHSCVSDYIYLKRFNNSLYEAFRDWGQGLACGSLFDYYFNVSAKDLIASILEETNEEKDKYKEYQAEELMTKLIYREVNILKYIELK